MVGYHNIRQQWGLQEVQIKKYQAICCNLCFVNLNSLVPSRCQAAFLALHNPPNMLHFKISWLFSLSGNYHFILLSVYSTLTSFSTPDLPLHLLSCWIRDKIMFEAVIFVMRYRDQLHQSFFQLNSNWEPPL